MDQLTLDAPVRLFPAIDRLLSHAMTPTELGLSRPGLMLAQHRDDLLPPGEPTRPHRVLPCDRRGLSLSLVQFSGAPALSMLGRPTFR